MKLGTIAGRSLRFYWRSHLGVMLGVLISTAVLTGALMVGDSVQATLLHQNLQRLGRVEYALSHPTRFMRAALADALQEDLRTTVAPVLHVSGMASSSTGSSRANRVFVYGIDQRFWNMGERIPQVAENTEGVWINSKLAEYLKIETGETLLLRVDKPTLLSRDSPLSTYEDTSAVLRLPVAGIVDEMQMGRFDLRANQVVPFNAYVPLEILQNEVGQVGKVNMLLVRAAEDFTITSGQVQNTLQKHWRLEDAQLELRALPDSALVELRTERIFLDDVVARVLEALDFHTVIPGNEIHPIGVLTYLVNELGANGRSVPYSTVAAIAGIPGEQSAYPAVQGMEEGQIVIHEWLAEDLQAKPGDTLSMRYFVLGQGRNLEEKEQTFTVARVIPMDAPVNDPELMPEFPGIANRENCRDWDPGFDIDVRQIRDRDEEYWDQYQGTPKAYIALEAGQNIWSNRFGNLTAIRFQTGGAAAAEELLAPLRALLERSFQPFMFGFVFQPVREMAINAATQSMNFAPLFLGFSFFLIIASLILVALLFLFQVEQRVEQTGILLAHGFTPGMVRRLYLTEGFGISCLGSLLGILFAILYTWLLLLGLSTIWKDATGGIDFQFVITPLTLLYGFLGGLSITLIALWFGLRKQAQVEVRELLSSAGQYHTAVALKSWTSTRKGLWICAAGVLASLLLILLIPTEDPMAAAGKFFGAGTFLLIACLGLSQYLIRSFSSPREVQNVSLLLFGVRNTARRSGRSLAIVGLLACGSFLVIAVGANRHDPLAHAGDQSSGTGGFAFFGETTLPLLHDINTEEGSTKYGMSREELEGVTVIPLRMRQGDEASCLNLNRAQTPRLLGVPVKALAELNAFSLASVLEPGNPEKGWNLLQEPLEEGVIPGIADQATVQWALGKSLGDRIMYMDEQGNSFQVQLVATLANSILQGNILIAEEQFVRHYPSISGYQYLLVDAPEERKGEVEELLSFALQDIGLQLTPAEERLATFYAVENTYLSIFQILGSLGLILGAAGIAVVVLRNVLERRGELALLQAVGFSRDSIRWLIISEHWMLLLLGLGSGVLAGFMAVLPHLISRNSEIPYLSLGFTLVAMFGFGILWIWLAGLIALRGNLVQVLQNE